MPHLVLNDSEIGCFECSKWEYKYNRKLKDSMIRRVFWSWFNISTLGAIFSKSCQWCLLPLDHMISCRTRWESSGLFELSRCIRTPWFHPYKVPDRLGTEWDWVSSGCEQVLEVRGDTVAFWQDRGVVWDSWSTVPNLYSTYSLNFISLNVKMDCFLMLIFINLSKG